MKRRQLLQATTLSLAFALPLLGCGKKAPPSDESAPGAAVAPVKKDVSLSGAGATFPFPLYSKWMSEYNRLHPEVKINYQSIGSGGGIRQVTSGTVDFGASDAPMSESDMKKAPKPIVHIPTTIGAVVVAYNVQGLTAPLQLDGPTLGNIFLGKVTKWNDPAIAASNPGVTLPATDIAVVTRSDGSGTTAVFSGYLASVNPEFKEKVGEGKSVKWPAGLGAKGNEGVTGQVKTTPGTIGYLELAYATQSKLPHAAIKNAAGDFTGASIDAITKAAANIPLGDDLTATLANAPGAGVYPISSYTYILVYPEAADAAKGAALANFLWWATHEGQALAGPLHYAPLPEPSVKKIEAKLKTFTAGGKPILP